MVQGDPKIFTCSIDINEDGSYSYSSDSIVAIPVIGHMEFLTSFYKSLRYPAVARESGIEGQVGLEILTDKNGKVTHIEVVESLHEECDKACLKLSRSLLIDGFNPIIIDGEKKPFKAKMYVRFRLG